MKILKTNQPEKKSSVGYNFKKHMQKRWGYYAGLGVLTALCFGLLCNNHGLNKKYSELERQVKQADSLRYVDSTKTNRQGMIVGLQSGDGSFTYETTEKEPCTDY
ncbi:MAG: hypothetical protein ACPLXC_01195 [Candidatus Pacearchaeota archaeon]